MIRCDVLVLGTGGVGSAALYHLARRGLSVIGLDRFPPGHDRGSSHGQTRIIRKAYFEHPDYVPLLQRAYSLWSELEADGPQLYFPVGLLEIGPPEGIVVPGVRASARRYALPIEELSQDDIARRYPGFRLPDGCQAIFEREAGYLLVEACVLRHVERARQAGARYIEEEVLQWAAHAGGVTVQTARETYQADRLVIAAGAWAGSLLGQLGVALRVVRKHLHWYACDDPRYFAAAGCPAFFYELGGYYYGFPQIDARGVKVAEHHGGTPVTNPLHDARDVEPDEQARVETFLRQMLPGVSHRATDHAVCYYTLSPDEHFIVDRHPEHERVVFAAGLSGHGFKFTTVLGEILADLSLEGRSPLPIEFLRCRRFTRAERN
jgi:monomeric sarcosine oxidase